MTVRRFGSLLLLFLAVACTVKSPPLVNDCSGWACRYQFGDPSFSFITLRRSWGPDADPATWRVSVDELTCTLTHGASTGTPSAVATCATDDQPDAPRVPLFVSAATTPEGFGRLLRIDTMGRAVSHVRVERDGVLVDAFDHRPTFTTTPECETFVYDMGGERELPPVP